MKKILGVLFNTFVLFSLISCGGNKSSSQETSKEIVSSNSISNTESHVEVSSSRDNSSTSYLLTTSTSNDAEEFWSSEPSSESTTQSSKESTSSEAISSEIITSSLSVSSLDTSSTVSSSSHEETTSSASSEEPSSSSSEQNETYYHVTFVNYDDTVLYEVDVLEGHEAVYSGETPTKEADDEFTYEFDGWDQDLSSISSDVTTVAQFKANAKENWGHIIRP